MTDLTPKQALFVEYYLIELNATKAAIDAGYAEKYAARNTHKLLNHPKIKAAIDAAMKIRSERTGITQDIVLQRIWSIATGDPNKITQFRRVNCRHCHGIDHLHQWVDEDEFEKACATAVTKGMPEPSKLGGFGFHKNMTPNESCPICAGEGEGRIHITDTNLLSGPEKELFAGVKAGRDGVEVKLHDKMKALEMAARHVGLFKDSNDQKLQEFAIKRADLELQSIELEQDRMKLDLESKRIENERKKLELEQMRKAQAAANGTTHNIMPVPTADSVDGWETVAQAHHDKVLMS